MIAAVLTIGTEITDGQIVDSNSQWISQQLDTYSIRTVLHLSVPDEHDNMIEALHYACTKADFIFVCGGLGPTSDDFTRDIISEYFKAPLELHNPTWTTIQEKLSSRNVTLREGHRKQALIPQNSQVLDNDVGVAPGFYLENNNKKIWVLPGPPKEIAAIWAKHIIPHLSGFEHELELTTWQCTGVPESELAFITEDYFSKFLFKKKFGYRFQGKTVEIKLWHEKNNSQARLAIDNFTTLIKKYLV